MMRTMMNREFTRTERGSPLFIVVMGNPNSDAERQAVVQLDATETVLQLELDAETLNAVADSIQPVPDMVEPVMDMG